MILHKLTPRESTKLKRILREKHGNVKAAQQVSGLAKGTIKRAADGLELKAENINIIKETILKCQN
jgi:hypothetical protein